MPITVTTNPSTPSNQVLPNNNVGQSVVNQQQTIQQGTSSAQAAFMDQSASGSAIPPLSGTAQQPQQTQATPPPATDPQLATGIQVPRISRLIGLVYQADNLSEEGTKYFDKLREALTSSQVQQQMTIKVHQLATPAGAIAVENHGHVFLVVPTEGLTLDQNLPRTVILRKAMDCYKTTVNATHQLLQSLIITPHDYPKVGVLINSILNCFRVISLPEFQNMTVDTLTGDHFVVNTNVNEAIGYLKTRYPHTVLPRADMVFLLSLQSKDSRNGYNQKPINYFEQGNLENTPIACVTGYTEILASPNTFNGAPKYVPIVHITGMISDIPDFRMTTLLLPLAADVFIRAKLWRNQFSQFDRNKPNLGKLFRNPENNGFMECTNPQLRDIILDQYFEHPSMVLDVQEGTYRIPGIESYAMTEATQSILQRYSNFLNTSVPVISASQFYCHEYTGIVNNDGQLADSRWADYLNTMVHWENSASQVSLFLNRDPNPKTRVDLIRQFYPNLEVLYSNFHTAIDLNFMSSVQNHIRDKIKIAQNTMLGIQNQIDLSYLINNGMSFQNAGTSGFAYGANAGIFGNPMSTIYNQQQQPQGFILK